MPYIFVAKIRKEKQIASKILFYGMDNEIFDTKLFLVNLNLHYFPVFTLIIYKILGSVHIYLANCQILPNFAMQKCVLGRADAQPVAL